ncbi:MAG: TRAP transporter large permease [Deltaproteobacteria bacterium]|nr:TRAP transporter large permease [Deltaproteobacteria bacterium]
MDPIVIGLIGIGVFLAALALGVHVGISLGFVGMAGCIAIYAQTLPFGTSFAITQNLLLNAVFATATDWVFIVLPLFILMGLLASEVGITEMAYSALAKWVGNSRGSLGIATVLGQTAFGICTGSSIVACTVFARVSAPEMTKYGYSKKFSYGLIAGTGSLGMIIPPSVLAIIYGLLSRESIGALFLAGVGPGMALSILFILAIVVMSRINPSLAPKVDLRASGKEKIRALVDFLPIMAVGFVIIYGILSGMFTPNEAGAIGSFIIFIIGILNRNLTLKRFLSAMKGTASSTGMVFIIFIMAKVFSRFLNLSGIAPSLIEHISNLPFPPLMIIIGFLLMYLVLGMFLDGISILVITVPLLVPVIEVLNIDMIWFAMVSILAIECGLVTPPVGLNVYAVKGVAGDDISLEDLFRGAFPFFLIMVLCVAVSVAFPSLITWLPKFIGPN